MNICLDTETTGLNPSFDEILQLSIIDSNTNEVLFNDYFKPQYTVCWDEAQAVNGISYDDVSNCKSITQSLAQIQNIIDRADKIYGYNVNFDHCLFRASRHRGQSGACRCNDRICRTVRRVELGI